MNYAGPMVFLLFIFALFGLAALAEWICGRRDD